LTATQMKTQTIDSVISKSSIELKNISDTPALDSDILAAHILNISKFDLLLKKKETPPEGFEIKFQKIINERKKGVPVAYLTNKKDFFEDTFFVDNRVLIPRPESEFIVTEAVSHLRKKEGEADVLDICCGSGCIGLSILRVSDCNLTLSDISKHALEVAEINRKNLFPLNNNIQIIESDLFQNIDGKFDVITANPPYLSEKDMSEFVQGSLEFEPRNALYGGKSGMEVTLKIIEQAQTYLKSDGVLIVELGYEGTQNIKTLASNIHLKKIIKDYNGITRTAVFQSSQIGN
jgi:release factor glutamine methyltransferase